MENKKEEYKKSLEEYEKSLEEYKRKLEQYKENFEIVNDSNKSEGDVIEENEEQVLIKKYAKEIESGIYKLEFIDNGADDYGDNVATLAKIIKVKKRPVEPQRPELITKEDRPIEPQRPEFININSNEDNKANGTEGHKTLYKDLSDEDLEKKLAELNAEYDEEYQFRAHEQNGMEENENDDTMDKLLEQIKAIKNEMKVRKENPLNSFTDDESKTMIDKLHKPELTPNSEEKHSFFSRIKDFFKKIKEKRKIVKSYKKVYGKDIVNHMKRYFKDTETLDETVSRFEKFKEIYFYPAFGKYLDEECYYNFLEIDSTIRNQNDSWYKKIDLADWIQNITELNLFIKKEEKSKELTNNRFRNETFGKAQNTDYSPEIEGKNEYDSAGIERD